MFPSTISTFPQPTPTNRLNNPSHSGLHNSETAEIVQIETVIGTDSSVIGTIIGDLRNPASDGGGHVQSANKGGTGQTNYTKGDILVASSQSVLTKLAVGGEGQVLISSTAAATGLTWATPGGSKIINSASVITVLGNDTPTSAVSIMSATIPGSTLGTNNAVKGTAYMRRYTHGGGSPSVLIRATYGGNTVASIMWREVANPLGSVSGVFNYTLIGNNNVAAQRAILEINPYFYREVGGGVPTSVLGVMYDSNTASVQSSANQSFGITVQMQTGDMTIDGSTIEKIV